MTTPALPPGFVLDQPQAQGGVPPLPPGFQLDQRADFSGVQSGSSTTETDDAARRAQHPIGSALGEIGGRQVLQGAAGLFGALGGDAINHYIVDPIRRAVHEPTLSGLITGENQVAPSRTYRQAASDFADSVGMRQPQTSGERIASDVGEALTGTALTMGAGALAGQGNALGRLLTAQPVLQAASTATGSGAGSIARESGASEKNQLLAGLAGGLAPGAGQVAGAATLRGLLRGGQGGRAAMTENTANFLAGGATPTVGQATGNRRTQALETLLANVPGGSGPMARKAVGQAGSFGQRLDDLAANLSPGRGGISPQDAGASIQQGAKTYAKNVGANRRALYWQADQLIPEKTPVPMASTWKAITEITTPKAGATATTGAMINPSLIRLRDNLMQDLSAGGGRVPYSALKAIRTSIGEQISDFALSSDTPTRQLRRLYGAMSDDMQAAARAQGPAAERAARYANNYYKITEKRLEQLDRVIDKNGGPERVYDALYSGAQRGSTTLETVMQSIPKESQKDFTAAVLRQMGRATPGQQNAATDAFSMNTFLTNWSRLRPESRKVLFDRYGPGFSQNMDRIAKMAGNVREGSTVFANPSGTARLQTLIGAASTTGGTIGTLFATGHPGLALGVAAGAAGGYGATNWLARKMTDPKFVAWLANSTSLPVAAIPAQANMLRQIGERDGDPDYIAAADWLEQNNPQRVQGQTN